MELSFIRNVLRNRGLLLCMLFVTSCSEWAPDAAIPCGLEDKCPGNDTDTVDAAMVDAAMVGAVVADAAMVDAVVADAVIDAAVIDAAVIDAAVDAAPPPDGPSQSSCGDGILDPGEDVDPPPGPSSVVPVDPLTCRYDFSAITQLYCAGICGNWDGSADCGQGDADAFCRLKTGDPDSIATAFMISQSRAEPGICCPSPSLSDPSTLGCVSLQHFEDRGVDLLVSVHESDLLASHGAGGVVTDIECD